MTRRFNAGSPASCYGGRAPQTVRVAPPSPFLGTTLSISAPSPQSFELNLRVSVLYHNVFCASVSKRRPKVIVSLPDTISVFESFHRNAHFQIGGETCTIKGTIRQSKGTSHFKGRGRAERGERKASPAPTPPPCTGKRAGYHLGSFPGSGVGCRGQEKGLLTRLS